MAVLRETMISIEYPQDYQQITSVCAFKIAYFLLTLISRLVFTTDIFDSYDEQLLSIIFRLIMHLHYRKVKKLLYSTLKLGNIFSSFINSFLSTWNFERILKRYHIRIRIQFEESFDLDVVSLIC